jgi:hypothetical protein
MATKRVLVSGATGQQGGAVVAAPSEWTGIDDVTFPEYLDAHWGSRSAPASA